MDFRTALYQKRLYFDGGYGTLFEEMSGVFLPSEQQNLRAPEMVLSAHRAYLAAGCNILTANTFGINRDKYPAYREMIAAALSLAKEARGTREDVYIAYDLGPTGRMLAPMGDLAFEDAVALFAANVREAAACGADLILIETMNDCSETKAAVLAAKENSDLPIVVTNAYDEGGKLMTGADPLAMIVMLEGLGVDAIGMNCSFGPDAMLRLVDTFLTYSSLPIVTNPNAGLPAVREGKTVYLIDPDEFAADMRKLAEKGVAVLGGCCGTTPAYLAKTVEETQNIPLTVPRKKQFTAVSSYTHAVLFADRPVRIGERINPTGKPKLREALKTGNLEYILNEGIRQADAGADILDCNVGLPEIDEGETMERVVTALQSVTDLPIQIDSPSPDVLARAMRVYCGKPLVNSVNGKKESMEAVFPLIRRYGGTVIALTIDEEGIPDSAAGRFAIAEKIAAKAAEYGIEKKDLIVDPLCLAVSSDGESGKTVLESIRLLHEGGYKTSLGVSNISFGLPQRDLVNSAFFSAALLAGLDCAILNPFSEPMKNAYFAATALSGKDSGCAAYIAYAANAAPAPATQAPSGGPSLRAAIEAGLSGEARRGAIEALKNASPLQVIDSEIVPALAAVGEQFEKKTLFLPQLLMSAEAASAAFGVVREKLPKGQSESERGVILATVRGDIHDIGKNIVKVLLESYGYTVFDLGKNVEPAAVLDAVRRHHCRFVGLSALMTTTVPAMEETVRLLHESEPETRVMVGGAVLNPEYAAMIHADAYAPDAMGAVHLADEFYGVRRG